jgi:hypothetical protein
MHVQQKMASVYVHIPPTCSDNAVRYAEVASAVDIMRLDTYGRNTYDSMPIRPCLGGGTHFSPSVSDVLQSITGFYNIDPSKISLGMANYAHDYRCMAEPTIQGSAYDLDRVVVFGGDVCSRCQTSPSWYENAQWNYEYRFGQVDHDSQIWSRRFPDFSAFGVAMNEASATYSVEQVTIWSLNHVCMDAAGALIIPSSHQDDAAQFFSRGQAAPVGAAFRLVPSGTAKGQHHVVLNTAANVGVDAELRVRGANGTTVSWEMVPQGALYSTQLTAGGDSGRVAILFEDQSGSYQVEVIPGLGADPSQLYDLIGCYGSNQQVIASNEPLGTTPRTFEVVLNSPVGIAVPPDVPTASKLYDAVPNPFNPTVTICFDLSQSAWVRLTVFDARGRRMRALMAEERSAGRCEVKWDGTSDSGRRVSSGVYFYRLDAGSFRETKRMTLVR